MRNLKDAIGYQPNLKQSVLENQFLQEYVNLKLISVGLPQHESVETPFMDMAEPVMQAHRQQQALLNNYRCPADSRIQDFIEQYLKGASNKTPQLPHHTLVLDQHGMSRVLSIPPDKDAYETDIIKSYRVKQGVLHNPKHDKRTTKGTFHIAEGGLPIPADKIAVPIEVFKGLLDEALAPPKELMKLPYTSSQENEAQSWVSLLLRPLVCPAVPGRSPEKRMEIRFFAPGSLVSNLDFVESIFGNAGDPMLPENDAGLDIEHWSGQTGCVILAPHLIYCRKKDLGLPHVDDATERQKRDGMFWEKENEPYNNGTPFKITARDRSGTVVTLIADNYFGYSKKEVKTQISFACNLSGFSEEEHAGGAVTFPVFDLGEHFRMTEELRKQLRCTPEHTYENVCRLLKGSITPQPEGYAVDNQEPFLIYVPEDAFFDLSSQTVSWTKENQPQAIDLKPDYTYMLPSGYKVWIVLPQKGRRWRLVGCTAEGTYCHKPSTVSGGGKSEISKPVSDAIVTGPVFVSEFEKDMDEVEKIIDQEYGNRFKDAGRCKDKGRPILGQERSLGSVIKLLTPQPEYKEDYNQWLEQIPHSVKQLVFVLKRVYQPEWGNNWREHFSVDTVDGTYGYELKFDEQKLVAAYMRLGYTEGGAWRTFGLRKDYHPAVKLQAEDDITASVVVPAQQLDYLDTRYKDPSVKCAENVEYRLFQRPDDAIVRGYDKHTEHDLSQAGNFLSNYQPLNHQEVADICKKTIPFDQFTEPMKNLLNEFVHEQRPEYCVSSANPRLVDGEPTKNPRYLQDRGDLQKPDTYTIADIGTRLYRQIPQEKPLIRPVNAILPGRRNNPPDKTVGPLCVFNPIHYLPLPELFMEYISSMTGKSPSTTGAGSEGALTKAPFNMLCPIIDLNNALVSHILTQQPVFITAAGYLGPHCKIEHDLSFLIPELWARMRVEERDAEYLIQEGYLEKCEPYDEDNQTIPANILGYRITQRFVTNFFGRLFGNPDALFEERMLKPEKQDQSIFSEGIRLIQSTHKQVAQHYFEDGSYQDACPPLKALLHIMIEGEYQGMTLESPAFRNLFTRENLLSSDWYHERLQAGQNKQNAQWKKHLQYLDTCLQKGTTDEQQRDEIQKKIQYAQSQLDKTAAPDYLENLHGTIGLDPSVLP